MPVQFDIYIYIYIYMYTLTVHRNTRHSNSDAQHVGSETQCALCQYIMLTVKAKNSIHHKMQCL